MKLAKLIIVALAVALFAVACGDSTSTNQTANTGGAQATPAASPKATATPTPDELAEAKTTFMQTCAACHQEKGEGGMVKIEGKRLKVPSLLEGHGLSHTDAEFAKQIANGGDGMPAFKDRLNTEQINNLVRFIRRDIQAGLTQKGGSH
ncbi:MAG: cytochrome c6 [Acidobacteriota bacterium]|jgi:mono/diheme cytochrome c family protein|nr:cytochrome c6 [Acidobacteriota bacterium]